MIYEGEYLFEGEFRNGKRNGIGKEYKGKTLVFEGEFSNGIRNGKGKEYNWDGKLIYEGEYLNRMRNGKGKEYDFYGKLIFEGEYLNGRQCRKCIIIWREVLIIKIYILLDYNFRISIK